MILREDAFKLVTTWTENKQSLPHRGKNLIKHMLAVESAMRGLYSSLNTVHSSQDEDLWGLVGLLHDADYEKYPEEHPKKIIEELEKNPPSSDSVEAGKIIDAIRAHAWKYNGMDREPQNNLEWSIYCCDELTGLIVAVALVRPEKKLSVVTVENILSKWNKKDFAKGVERENIELCEEKLGIKLPEFIQIVLSSMQSIATDLGL